MTSCGPDGQSVHGFLESRCVPLPDVSRVSFSRQPGSLSVSVCDPQEELALRHSARGGPAWFGVQHRASSSQRPLRTWWNFSATSRLLPDPSHGCPSAAGRQERWPGAVACSCPLSLGGGTFSPVSGTRWPGSAEHSQEPVRGPVHCQTPAPLQIPGPERLHGPLAPKTVLTPHPGRLWFQPVRRPWQQRQGVGAGQADPRIEGRKRISAESALGCSTTDPAPCVRLQAPPYPPRPHLPSVAGTRPLLPASSLLGSPRPPRPPLLLSSTVGTAPSMAALPPPRWWSEPGDRP